MLNELANRSLEDCYRWFPGWNEQAVTTQVLQYTLGIAGESGEVVELIKKWHSGRAGYDLNSESLRARVVEELCDVLVYAFDLAAVLKLDLDEAMELKRASNETRFGN